MKITLNQVNEDIKSGKSTTIYYSSATAWWTHLDDDVAESTKMGEASAEKQHNIFLARKDVPVHEKLRISNLYESSKKSHIPLDVTGSPLFMAPADKFMEKATSKPDHYGKHGMDTFMKAHHQNCNGLASSKWEFYNQLIDAEK